MIDYQNAKIRYYIMDLIKYSTFNIHQIAKATGQSIQTIFADWCSISSPLAPLYII